MKFWVYIDDNCIIKWKINCVYIPVLGFSADSYPIHIQYLHTITGITSNTKIFVTNFTEGTQAIRPSCTQISMATHGKILYYYGGKKKSLIGCLICQDILYIELLLSEHTKIFQKKSKRIFFFLPFR